MPTTVIASYITNLLVPKFSRALKMVIRLIKVINIDRKWTCLSIRANEFLMNLLSDLNIVFSFLWFMGAGVFALHQADGFVHFFKSGAARRERKNGIFFLQSFFFCASCFKRKSVKGIWVSIDSGTNYSNCLSFIHFFFGSIGASFLDWLTSVICFAKSKEEI